MNTPAQAGRQAGRVGNNSARQVRDIAAQVRQALGRLLPDDWVAPPPLGSGEFHAKERRETYAHCRDVYRNEAASG